jgi:serine/threonine-protein kinase
MRALRGCGRGRRGFFGQNGFDDPIDAMSIRKLGRYDIVRVLGKGAMGLVYEARDPNLDRRVAIKTIKVENLSAEASADYEARFRTEARSAARLQHPNIVSVYDSGRHDDVAYLVMEFVQGDDLKQHLDGGRRYSLQESLGIVRDLLAALDYAHRQNIVHRDVKPANLLVEASGRVKLTDFGVARIQDSGEATRTKGSMVGTLKYMSPEQVQGLPVDARADLFAAGIVLYQLLTGKRPFDGDSEFAIIQQIVSQHPAAPSSINPQLPPALDGLVARALSKQRDDRFATAHDFSLALQEASGLAPDPTIVPPPSQRDARAGSSTGSGALRSRSGSTASLGSPGEGSGSTVTQELELVYWKDVKDSDDPQDLQGFMERFPAGIYADLARRRLKKLEDRARGEHSGTLSATMALPAATTPNAGTGAASAGATTSLPDEATLVQVRPPLAAGAAPPPAASDGGATPVPPEDATVARAAPPGPAAQAPAPDAAPTPGRRARGPLYAVAAVAVLAVAGIVFKMFPGSPVADTLPAAAVPAPLAGPAAAPAGTASVSPPAVAAATQGPAAPTVPKPASRPASAAADKSLPQPPSAKAALAAAPPAAVQVAPSAPAAAAKPVVPRPAAEPSGPATVGGPTSPAKACEGRVLLGFQSCMNEQCAKPAFANLPACVERRGATNLNRNTQGSERN